MRNVMKLLIGGLIGSVVTYTVIKLIDNNDETKNQEAEAKSEAIVKAANEKVNALTEELDKTNKLLGETTADADKLAEKLEKTSKECKSVKKDAKKLQNKLDNAKEQIEFKKVQLEACEKIAEIIDESEYKDEVTYTDGTVTYADHYEASVIETSINAIHAIADAKDDDEVIDIVKEAVASLEDFFKELDAYEDDDNDEDDEDSDDETEDDEDGTDEEDADLSASIDQLIYGGDDADDSHEEEGEDFSNKGELITENGGSPLQTNKATEQQPVVEDTPEEEKNVLVITGKNGIKDTTGQVEIIRPYPKYRPDGSMYYDGSLLYRNGPDTWVWDDSTNKSLGKLFTALFGKEGNDEFSTLSDSNRQDYRSSSRNRRYKDKHNVESKEEITTSKGEDSKEERPQTSTEVIPDVEEPTTEYVIESAPTKEADRYVLANKVKNDAYRQKYFYTIANAIDDKNIRNEQLSKIVYILNKVDQLTGTDKMKYELKMDAIIQELFNPRGINVFQEIDKIWKLMRG